MNSYDCHGSENYDNPHTYEIRSYTFGEPLELVVERLMARVDALEVALSEAGTTVSLDLFCGDCPGRGEGCCLDEPI